MTHAELEQKVHELIDKAVSGGVNEVRLAIAEIALETTHDYDNDGQLILYTGIFSF